MALQVFADIESPAQITRAHIKQEIRNRIQNVLETAKYLPPEACTQLVRDQLFEIQSYCQQVGKNFIFVEEEIICNQYDLNGACDDVATLFRGPDERASVAICVTQKGSLLHRNDCEWKVYRDAGDIFSTVELVG